MKWTKFTKKELRKMSKKQLISNYKSIQSLFDRQYKKNVLNSVDTPNKKIMVELDKMDTQTGRYTDVLKEIGCEV